MRIVNLCLVVMLVALQFRIWVGEGSLAEVWRFSGEIELQRERNIEMTTHNRQLHAEVLDLKQGLEAIEERARRDLGMIGRQEVFYQVLGN